MQVVELNDDIMCKSGSGNKIYWMVTSEMGAPVAEMRYIEIQPGSCTSFGSHAHEHEVYIVRGKGRVKGLVDGTMGEKELRAGVAVFIPGNEEHQFLNDLAYEPLGILCIVPVGAEAEHKPPCSN
jgi:quercetin dioxygenase-like cupin family protein